MALGTPTRSPRPGSRRPRPSPWLVLGALSFLLGAAVVGWSWSQERRLQHALIAMLRSHVESVVRLVAEGARQTAMAGDTAAELQEAQLHTLANLLVHAEASAQAADGAADIGLRARLREVSPGVFVGQTWRLEPIRRSALLATLADAEENATLEERLLAQLQLACVIEHRAPRRHVLCWDGAQFHRLRKESGLGPLLAQVASPPVVYVAIQDEGGLLAASPGVGPLSAWAEDAALERARRGELTFRDTSSRSSPLVEGLSPFVLPDGTTVVLRIGMDARPTRALVDDARRRHHVLVSIVALLVLVTSLGGWALLRRDRRLASIEHRMLLQEQQQRHWRTLGQLAAEVAHEVRNPLSTVKMVAQRLAREFSVGERDQAEYADLVGMLTRESGRVADVVSEFLDLSRPLSLRLEEVELGGLLAQSLAPLRLRAEEEGKQLSLLPGGAVRLRLDAGRIHQAVVNLVGNALDAIRPGGRVEVAVRVDEGEARMCISDDGPGMTREMLERVQQPFVTSKPKGTGLGLVLARRLVEAHGGSLELESAEGKGTNALVRLPLVADVREESREEADA